MAVVCDRSLYNVVFMGIAFMLVFTSFQTGAMIEPVVLEDVQNETKYSPNPFTGTGYTSLSVIYLVFAFANWIAAPIVAVVGPRVGMFIGAVIYSGFIASFLGPQTWLLYLMSVLLGIAAAIIWTAQGNFLTLNSTKETMGRNSGLFWALFQCSLLFGNLFVFLEFRGLTTISKSTRTVVYGGLTGTAVLGTLLLLVLQKPPNSDDQATVNEDLGGSEVSPWRRMVLELSLELTFFSGVYGTCITHTAAFADAKDSYIGYSGMLIGAGEILGGLLFGILGSTTNKYGRDIIVLLGFLVHMVTFFLIFINLPDESPIKLSSEPTYIVPSPAVALLCSFLLGFGDSCFNTQIYSILGVLYSDNSGSAFSLFKFVQSLSAAIAFFYSMYLVMKWQLLILVIMGTLGAVSFFKVAWSASKRTGYNHIPHSD
ncbi:UNC93-like protein MFSD11 isoform X2 [Watersipora subatra]|uniref:UNC93-like protein MFSD11 isoform X2 n=1 Tax=Watersipora subatra TaxID=2589382 RepID=UPI00355AEB39